MYMSLCVYVLSIQGLNVSAVFFLLAINETQKCSSFQSLANTKRFCLHILRGKMLLNIWEGEKPNDLKKAKVCFTCHKNTCDAC